MTTVIGIKVYNRVESATAVQEVLTECGCSIKTRIGLHNVGCGSCAPYGLVLVEVVEDSDAAVIEKKLLEISDVEIQHMVFE